jgi:A/G-specific adenine glycosylase
MPTDKISCWVQISNDFLLPYNCQHLVKIPKREKAQAKTIAVPLATPERIRTFQQYLLQWYEENGRDLPWRHTRDPYRILVSEIMLHQTQVDRVIPKYYEFLNKYPSFEALAAAPVEELQELWRPLGYNFRPGRLHQIAKYVVTNYNGELPNTLKDLMALPGIGRYTAGAILSFAFHKDAPILDTNAQRVFQRYFAVTGDPFRVPAKKQLWYLAEITIPPGKAYLFNQALLDFGALHCKARKPLCPICSLSNSCPYGQTQLEIIH